MYGIILYSWLIFMVNVGKYTIHGYYGNPSNNIKQVVVFETDLSISTILESVIIVIIIIITMTTTSWWFFTNPSEKYAQVKLDHFPKGEHKAI